PERMFPRPDALLPGPKRLLPGPERLLLWLERLLPGPERLLPEPERMFPRPERLLPVLLLGSGRTAVSRAPNRGTAAPPWLTAELGRSGFSEQMQLI
ncbi:MAG: hypothetical protein ACK56F_08680, partial [bacterium]